MKPNYDPVLGHDQLAPATIDPSLAEPDRSCYQCDHRAVCRVYAAWRALLGVGMAAGNFLEPKTEDFNRQARLIAGMCQEFREIVPEAPDA